METNAPIFQEKPEDVAATALVLQAVARERNYQRVLWGNAHDDAHKEYDWYALISAWNEKARSTLPPETYRLRLIQIAALAVAAVEQIDRR